MADLVKIVGVRFKKSGKVYSFDPANIDFNYGDDVVVETTRGLEIGTVITPPKLISPEELKEQLKPVIRKPTDEDYQNKKKHGEKLVEVLLATQELATKHNLPMKIVDGEYNLDGNHLTVYFRAEGRVDFRELVKELNSTLKTKVELRQLGPRDETKIIGGMGRCGRQLCCAAFLTEFSPLSIKMAKEQDLPLNPMKISGTCGRLLCCLAYENEMYHAIRQNMPRVKQNITTPVGPAVVVSLNLLKETVSVKVESEAIVEFPLKDIVYERETTAQPNAVDEQIVTPGLENNGAE